MKDIIELITIFEQDTEKAIDNLTELKSQMDINAFDYNTYNGRMMEAEINLTYLNTIKNAVVNFVEKQLSNCPTSESNNESMKNIVIDCRPRPQGLDEIQEALDTLYPNHLDEDDNYEA